MINKILTKRCLSPKTWAMMMALKNLALGIIIIIGGSTWLSLHQVEDRITTYFACGVILGIVNIVAGCILITALVQGKENVVLLYILVEFVIIFILTIFAAISTLDADLRWTCIVIFLLCFVLWYGLYNVYYFYLDMYSYNNSSVEARAEDIACHTRPNPLDSFPEKALDSTAV